MNTALSSFSRFRFATLYPTCFHVAAGIFALFLENPQALNLVSYCDLLNDLVNLTIFSNQSIDGIRSNKTSGVHPLPQRLERKVLVQIMVTNDIFPALPLRLRWHCRELCF
jgi:hypothetical protein